MASEPYFTEDAAYGGTVLSSSGDKIPTTTSTGPTFLAVTLKKSEQPRKKRRIEICAFSGAKIYPGKGKIYVRVDSRSFRFVNGKAESLFLQRKNPRKISWTVLFRRMHKKGISEEVAKKRTRRTVKHQRAVVGASWEAIRAKRNQKPEVRAAARAAALRDGKEKKKAEDAKKKAEKAKSASSAARGQPKFSKQGAKGAKVAIANTSR
ncbi:60S ribosomal protein L24 [Mortierella claussenii]|nr:60S ribosomal protein L24 [Mortierella claussenii]